MHVMLKLTKAILYAKGLRFGSLDGYERLIASLYGTPDRIPVIVQPYLYAMSMHGLTSDRFFREPETFVHASYNMASFFGADSWSPVFDFYNIEAEALGQSFIWREQDEPSVDKNDFLIKDKKDLLTLKSPQPGKSGRMPYVVESYQRFNDIMGFPPMCYTCSPFTLAVMIRGLTTFIMDMLEDPEFAHDLLTFLTDEVCIPWVGKLIDETGTAVVAMSDAQASLPIVSPKLIRTFVLPYVERTIKSTSTPQCTVLSTGVWGEGKIRHSREMLDLKMDMMLPGNRFRALRPFFLLVWKEDYEKTGIPLLKTYADEKSINLMLNVPPLLFDKGAVDDIVETVRKLISQGAGTGLFSLLLNMIPPGVSEEKIHTAVAAIKQMGTYPIRADIDQVAFEAPLFEPFEKWRKDHALPVRSG